jgi:hypothetical protein
MDQYVVNLDSSDIEAASAGLQVLDLFDLERDSSYPFLDGRNWRDHSWGRKIFTFGGKSVITPDDTYLVFGTIANDSDFQRAEQAAAAVADALRHALTCLKTRNEPLMIVRAGLPIMVYIASRLDPARDSLYFWKVVLYAAAFLVGTRRDQVFSAVDHGKMVVLNPPDVGGYRR